MLTRGVRPWAGFIVLAALAVFGTPLAVAEGTLHIVLVVDTKAQGIGKAMETNLKNLQAVLREIHDGNREFFTTHMKIHPPLKDGDVSPKGIRNVLTDLRIDRSDRVLFYFCGHGAWDRAAGHGREKLHLDADSPFRDNLFLQKGSDREKEYDRGKGHFLVTSGGEITRNEIRDILMRKNPSATFLITDCCSAYADFTPPERRRPAKWKVFRRLFYETEGLVDITAAKEGTLAWCNDEDGSYFTQAFVKYLCESAESIRREVPFARPVPFASREPFARREPFVANVSWNDFFGRVKEETKEIFAKANAKPLTEIKEAEAQTPYAFQLGGWPRQYVKQLVFENSAPFAIKVKVKFEDFDPKMQSWRNYEGEWILDPKTRTRLLFRETGLVVCARTFTYKAASVNNPNDALEEERQAAPEGGYEGRMEDFTVRLRQKEPPRMPVTPIFINPDAP